MVEKFLLKYGDGLFLFFILLGVAPLFLYEIEFNAPYVFAFRYLTIPIAAVCFYVAYVKLPTWKEKYGKGKRFIITLLAAAVFVLMSGGYVIWVNALVGTQEDVEISGVVKELNTHTGSKGRTTYSVIVETSSGGSITLELSKKEYGRLTVGSTYLQQWQKGSLGFLYRRK